MATDPELELIVLGSGTSSALPTIGCLTSPQGCLGCKSSQTPEGAANVRKNTSALLRVPPKEAGGRKRSVLIDCGKTFYAGALQYWAALGLREIDAVILTHPHSDAVLGLDDLRGWTLGGHIQSTIDLYVNQGTFDEISRSFPYLADASKATGGGDVPVFNWIVFDETKPFTVCDVDVTPLKVHHGIYFTQPPRPYTCMGFVFGGSISYLSDVSHIPDGVYEQIDEAAAARSRRLGLSDTRLPLLVLDCLKVLNHPSHFGLAQSIDALQRIRPLRTYFVGFAHGPTHDAWVHLCELLSRNASSTLPADAAPDTRYAMLINGTKERGPHEDKDAWAQNALRVVERDLPPRHLVPLWIRPAQDGMTIAVQYSGTVTCDVYRS